MEAWGHRLLLLLGMEMRASQEHEVSVPSLGTDFTLALPPAFVEAIARRAAAIVTESTAGTAQPFIGVDEAAEHLACKPQRIYDLVSQGRLDCHRDGRRLLFRRSDLDAYLARTASRG